MKNIALIDKLLQALLIANGGKIQLKDCEKLLDNLVNKHKVYMEFPDRQLEWHLEDYAATEEKSFFDMLEKMATAGELVNISLPAHCDNCDSRMVNKGVVDGKHVLNCSTCRLNYTFKLVHEGEPMDCDLDSETKPSI